MTSYTKTQTMTRVAVSEAVIVENIIQHYNLPMMQLAETYLAYLNQNMHASAQNTAAQIDMLRGHAMAYLRGMGFFPAIKPPVLVMAKQAIEDTTFIAGDGNVLVTKRGDWMIDNGNSVWSNIPLAFAFAYADANHMVSKLSPYMMGLLQQGWTPVLKNAIAWAKEIQSEVLQIPSPEGASTWVRGDYLLVGSLYEVWGNRSAVFNGEKGYKPAEVAQFTKQMLVDELRGIASNQSDAFTNARIHALIQRINEFGIDEAKPLEDWA